MNSCFFRTTPGSGSASLGGDLASGPLGGLEKNYHGYFCPYLPTQNKFLKFALYAPCTPLQAQEYHHISKENRHTYEILSQQQ